LSTIVEMNRDMRAHNSKAGAQHHPHALPATPNLSSRRYVPTAQLADAFVSEAIVAGAERIDARRRSPELKTQ
jgi:hypothetical protein